MVDRPTLAIIGAGRVGSTLAQTLHWRGYTVAAVYSRTEQSAQRLADALGSRVARSPTQAATSADLTFLTVPDDAIESVCEALAQDADLTGRAIVHTSGVSGLDVLEAAHKRSAWVGGLHPMLSIMDRDLSARMAFSVPWVAHAPDVTFGVEAADEPLRSWLDAIVQALNGVALWLHPGQDRARYHAAGVIAGNYVVTLFAEALGLLESLDINADESIIRPILVQLVQATLNNIKARGPAQALTGPIARGDVTTIRKHLAALDQSDPELAELYRLLGRRTLRLAPNLTEQQAKAILETLEAIHANDNS